MRSKKFYITTPLYSVNAKPHIGHAYTALAADVLARHLRSTDIPVHFQTGTDEHGANIETAAREKGVEPKAWCDLISAEFLALWKTLNISHDHFSRTTDAGHQAGVQAVFERLLGTGDIYKSGDTYFLRLSRHEKNLLEHYVRHPDFLSPRHRADEIIDFVRAGLKDLPVSRAGAEWGVPVKSDPAHTVCVWFDALLNYATGPGYHPEQPSADFHRVWPADVHLAGKESFRLHGVVWPAMLLALGAELPRKVYAHGWWTINGEKMSKSRGNFIKAEDVVRDYGVDALRYFLLREVPFGQDGDFSLEALRRRYNADLANDLGTLFSRVMNMAAGYLEHRLPHKPGSSEAFGELSSRTPGIHRSIEALQFSEALEQIWQGVNSLNRLIDAKKPWEMAKTDPAALRPFLNELVWCLRLVAGWLDPFMPDTASKMHLQLGVGMTSAGVEPQKHPPLFPRKQDEKPGAPGNN